MGIKRELKMLLPVLVAGVVITLLYAGLYFYKPIFFQYLDNNLYDVILQKRHNTAISSVPVIVDLDDASLEKYGQWPWPRYRMALLLEKIRQAGASAAGLDILFAESDRTSPKVLQSELKRDLQVDIDFAGLPEALLDNDQVFASILKNGNYVLGYFFEFGKQDEHHHEEAIRSVSPAVIKTPEAGELKDYLLEADHVIPPIPALSGSARGTGFINAVIDFDGVLRSTPLLIRYRDKIYPSLALATLQAAMGLKNVAVKLSPGGIESVRIGKTVVPLDQNGRMFLHFRGPGRTFPYISAADILGDKLEPDSLKGKIVFVGTSAAGLMDLRSMPLDEDYPGVETHATVIDNIIAGDFIFRPDWAKGLEFCLIIAVGVIIAILIVWSTARLTLPVVLVSAFGMWHGTVWCFDSYRMFVSPLFPFLTLATNFSLLTLMKFWITEREKRFFRSAFSRYVSKSVVDQLADSPEKLSLGGEEKEVSIFFSDVRGFTSISESLSPTQLTSLLHDYFTPMTKIINDNLGTIDKFIGDAIMAFWNAPLDVPDHRKMAMKSGVEMLAALGRLNVDFEKKYGFQINMGMGLHAGRVRVGNMGTDQLFNYTLIGDDVNLTSRLEGLTKYYGVRILISEVMQDAVPDGFRLQDLDMVRVKGKEEPIRIFGLYSGHKAKDPEELARYHEALRLYRNRNFTDALKMFAALKEANYGRMLYGLYEERCRIFIATPPPEDWDGVFRHTSK